MAQIRIRDAGGTLRTLTRIRMRDDAGTLRTIQRIRVRDATNVLRTVWQAMTAAASPTSVNGAASTSTIVTASSTATPTGGLAPFTYLWEAADYNYDFVNPTTPTAATTTFRRSGCAVGTDYIGDFRCTVTDATGFAVVTNYVSATITRT